MYTSASIFITLATLVTLSEIAVFGTFEKINVFKYFITEDENFFEVQILVLIPLLYILYCV